jgi:hypothetical protein
VIFDNSTRRQFASSLEEHKLNQPLSFNLEDPNLNMETVQEKYGMVILDKLNEQLKINPELVKIAGRWFPRALLVDVNIGYLNLAEALLDMEAGGPMSTVRVLEQIELPTDVNLKLTEFSLNHALQEDGRFDDVGPAGEIQWFLHRLEPDAVQNTPIFLRYKPIKYEVEPIEHLIKLFCNQISDEIEPIHQYVKTDEVSVSLIFPHWRSGTLPFNEQLSNIFPSAHESQRIKFIFSDRDTGKTFPGWVIRPDRYAFGLKDWYTENEIMPGSVVTIRRGNTPGIVEIYSGKKRPAREWVRTALIGADGGIVFAMLKQLVGSKLDERMSIAIPDKDAFDQFWEQNNRMHSSLEKTILSMMRELAKLTPQGHVHAHELYAAVNLVRRCPPGPILSVLSTQPQFNHLGDLYFRSNEDTLEGKNDA